MTPFLVYIATGITFVLLLNLIAWQIAGDPWDVIAALIGLYALTVFDLKIASPRWSVLRRLLPSVRWFDCVVYALPFALMGYRAYALQASPVDAYPLLFLALLPAYFLVGLYFVVRWRALRSGSHDRLQWLFGTGLSFQDRFHRYLNPRDGDTH